jgi:lipopolysaccharide transport system ATP-binding protein
MTDAIITIEQLGKKYVIAHRTERARYKTLRETMALKMRDVLNGWRARNGNNGAGEAAREEFWALRDISFDVKRGEVLGIIGRNGAGKSTLLKILSRITEPTHGEVRIRGRVASLLEVGTGFHPELTGRENIYLNGAILGMTKAEIKRKFDEIVAFSEVEKFLDTPVKRYSSGMYVRLAFAVAAHLEPEILIVDEVLAVGDFQFQKKCLGKMQDVAVKEGRTVLFVSHNLQAVRQLCSQSLVLERGQMAFHGDLAVGINRYSGSEGGALNTIVDLTDYPGSRGSGGVRLLQVEFQDESGAPALHVHRSGRLNVIVKFRIERDSYDFDLAMALVHVEGQRVFSELYSDQFTTLSLSLGEYQIQFSIPLRFLKLEAYFLVVAALENGAVADQVDGISIPEIIDPDANPHVESGRWGIVRVPLEWSEIRELAPADINASRSNPHAV